MFLAVVMCSDDDCDEVLEVYGKLLELDTLSCDCGCGMQVLGWPEPVE